MLFKSVLTVCVGNVCRSPVAEVLLSEACPHLRVASAGFNAPEGRGASPLMVEFAARDGVDLTQHRARRLSQAAPDTFDLLLVMEDAHLKEMAARLPHLRARTMLLSHWIGGQDIADPINEDEAFNERVYAEIQHAVTAWSSKLGGANV